MEPCVRRRWMAVAGDYVAGEVLVVNVAAAGVEDEDEEAGGGCGGR